MQPTGNRLLDSLDAGPFARLKPHFREVSLDLHQSLQRRYQPIAVATFPASGLISIVTTMQDGTSVEVGVAGCEGMLGVQAVLGDDVSPNDATVQIPGRALQLPVEILRREAQAGQQVQTVLLRYVQAFLNTAMQSVACNRAHLLEQRLARWLLTACDRSRSDQLRITHEFVATLLGVRRAGVTVACQSLQSAGLIHYSHGRIAISDREGLETAACECYGATKQEYTRLLGEIDTGSPAGLEHEHQPAE